MRKTILFTIFLLFSYNSYSQFEYCCEGFEYSYEITDDCCVEIAVFWPDTIPPCNDAGVLFQRYNTNESRYETQEHEWIEMGDSLKFIMCPIIGEHYVSFRIRLTVNIDSEENPKCNGDNIFVEGYTQHTDSVSLESCCNCPEDTEDWFTMRASKNPSCPDSMCYVTYDLNLPEEATCYKYLYFENVSTSYFSNAISIDDVTCAANGFDLCQFSECIRHGEQRIVNIYLQQDTNLMDYCMISDTVQCDTTGGCECENIEPCTPDCPSIAWEEKRYITFTSDSCPGCVIEAEYTWRDGCNGHQDLQITEMNMSTPGCDDCSVAELYGESMRRIIRKNDMNFHPRGLDPRDDTCSTIWRLGMGGCWAKWLLAIFDYSSGIPRPIGFEVRWSQCDSSDCCFQEYLVCRHSDGSVSTSALGDPGIVDCQGKVFDYIAPCSAKCNWLQSVEGYIGPAEDTSGTHGKLINYPRTENYYEIGLNTVVESDYVLFNIKNAEGKLCKISLFDINGNYIKQKEFNINSNLHHEYIKTNNLTSGVYLYSVELDGIKIFSNKINIVK